MKKFLPKILLMNLPRKPSRARFDARSLLDLFYCIKHHSVLHIEGAFFCEASIHSCDGLWLGFAQFKGVKCPIHLKKPVIQNSVS